MTKEEFEAIPIMGEIYPEERIIEGKKVIVAMQRPTYVLWNEPNEPMYYFYRMGKWRVGTYKGKQYRRIVESYWSGKDYIEPEAT